MAKPVVPSCKAPADKGKHIVLVFTVANIKEQSIKVALVGDGEEDASGSKEVVISFESYSPTKRYEKSLTLSEAVCTHGLQKNVNSKTLSLTLLKVAHHTGGPTPPTSPSASMAEAPPAPPEELLTARASERSGDAAGGPAEIQAEVPAPAPTPAAGNLKATAPAAPAAKKIEEPVGLDSDDELDDGGAGGAKGGAQASKGKKKRKKKSGKGPAQAVEVEAEEKDPSQDPEVLRTSEEYEKVRAEAQEARSKVHANSKDLDEADAREKRVGAKMKSLEEELGKCREEYHTARQRRDTCLAQRGKQEANAATLEQRAGTLQKEAKEVEKDVTERIRAEEHASAEKERLEKEAAEKLAQEEKAQLQEERRQRAEEERLQAAEEKRRKEAERKENADRRKQEQKEREAQEEEARQAKKRGGMAAASASSTAAAVTNAVANGDIPVLVGEAMKRLVVEATQLFPRDRVKATKMLEDASKSKGGLPALLCLSRCMEDAGDHAGSAVVLLRMLAHAEADNTFKETDGQEFAMKAMAVLKDHPAKLVECEHVFKLLAPKYAILSMGQMLLGAAKGAPSDAQKIRGGAQMEAPCKKPWSGPIIEEVSDTPAVVNPARSSAPPPGWALDSSSEGGAVWVLKLPVPSIESLAEVNLDINSTAVLLTPVDGGAIVAQSAVPTDAEADAASAKWSKKLRVLTIRMPQRP